MYLPIEVKQKKLKGWKNHEKYTRAQVALKTNHRKYSGSEYGSKGLENAWT